MLLCLPEDLSLLIVNDYLGASLRLLSALDETHCNHGHRTALLVLMAKLTVNEQEAAKYKPTQRIGIYLNWIDSRQVRLSAIHLNVFAVDAEVRLPGFRQLPSVLAVHLSNQHLANGIMPSPIVLYSFLALFPALKCLEIGSEGFSEFSTKHARICLQLHCPLQILAVKHCSSVCSIVMSNLVNKFSALQELSCSGIDGEALDFSQPDILVSRHCGWE